MVLLAPFLPFCGLSEEIVSRAQIVCGDRVEEAQSIYEGLIPDPRYARSRFSYFDCAILAWLVVLHLVNAFVNGPESLLPTPVGSVSHFFPGMAIVCGTGPPIHSLQPGLHQRHWAVPRRQAQVVLAISLRPRTAEFHSGVIYIICHVYVPSGQPETRLYRGTPDCSNDVRQYSG